jgi:hypothetical protein
MEFRLSNHIFITLLAVFWMGTVAGADPAATPTPISLFGSKAIQLSVDSQGLKQKEGGFICELDASLGGGHYSEWGETEEDARTIVTKKCSGQSGLLVCKKEKAKCQKDK